MNRTLIWLVISATATHLNAEPKPKKTIALERLATFDTGGSIDAGAAEIVAYDEETARVFFINGENDTLGILDIQTPNVPTLLSTISLPTPGGIVYSPTSVAVRNGLVAVSAGNATVVTNPGRVFFFDIDGNPITSLVVGVLPDMISFTPDGKYLLTADEGEPDTDYLVDPPGSVSIIRLFRYPGFHCGYFRLLEKHFSWLCKDGYYLPALVQPLVKVVGFEKFNNATLDPSVRIFGPDDGDADALPATAAQDFEPEYITFSENSRTAYITLQENNAIAVLDIDDARFTRIFGLGFKDHSVAGNGLDGTNPSGSASDAVNIELWPLSGMYLPDGIASYQVKGETYLVTANEGDVRDWDAFSEQRTVNDLLLAGPIAAPDLKNQLKLRNLKVTSTLGKTDPSCTVNCTYDKLFSFGARSFSIWRARDGKLIFDSGDDFEQITAARHAIPSPKFVFNANHTNNTLDDRSDDKGPEPEGVALGEIRGRTYAFIGLERISGVMAYDVTDPKNPEFVQYFNDRDFTKAPDQAGDLGPEGLAFISAKDSPTGDPLLVLGNEVSGTVGILRIVLVEK